MQIPAIRGAQRFEPGIEPGVVRCVVPISGDAAIALKRAAVRSSAGPAAVDAICIGCPGVRAPGVERVQLRPERVALFIAGAQQFGVAEVFPEQANGTSIPKARFLLREQKLISVFNDAGKLLYRRRRSAAEVGVSMRLKGDDSNGHPGMSRRGYIEIKRTRLGMAVVDLRKDCSEQASLLHDDDRRFELGTRNEVICFALDVLRPDEVERAGVVIHLYVTRREEVIAILD